ncbi:unnamed protein product [Didymodactylos carnosus]|uniref:Ig-like domain-containing protein n=1 Tax=Didymodactylos carnosus TaxID=1234261 RepID=A0A814U2X6_9BILA|nr:unnamed protein product [Didymodactylos carnosus]CAF3931832.1 unnamed protein product [Didymodactylos carnosus]
MMNILLEGDSWDFSCSDVNVQAVTKAIMKNGKPLPTNTQKYVFTPKGVTIKNLTPADSGSYKCQRAPKPMTWTFNVDVKPKGSGTYACKTLEQQNWISTDIIVTKRIGPGGMARLPIANSTKVPK